MNAALRSAALALFLSGVALSVQAAGESNVGSCGWGTKLFDGQSGIAPQVLAVTTNGAFWNQTFGVSFGTSGCTQDGAVTSSWKTALFIDGNRERLARDMSRGSGESLDSLIALMGVEDEDQARFVRVTKSDLDQIFPSVTSGTEEIMAGLKRVLASDRALAPYSTAI